MGENTSDEKKEAVGVDGIRMRARRGTLGEYEIMISAKYCGNGLLMIMNGGRSSRPTRRRYATTK